MTEKENKFKDIIDKGSEISGGVYGTTIGLLIGGPVGALAGAVVGPVAAGLFKKVGTELSEKYLTTREEIRVGATFSMAINKLDERIKNGNKIRTDDFYKTQVGDRSKAEILLEGTLLKSRNEYEEKKLIYYSNFLANLNLDDSISFEKGNTLLRIIEKLSYRQLVIIAYVNSVNYLDTNNWRVAFTKSIEIGQYQDLYSEIMDLYNQQIFQQHGGISLGITKLEVSPLGKELYNLLELDQIPTEDMIIVNDTINKINDSNL